MQKGLFSLIGIIAVVFAALAATIASGYRPNLGIDLTGGVEVVLQPGEDPNRDGDPTDEQLDQAVEILRNRVDGLEVAQPDITRQGQRVVVQLPDVDDQQQAIELVGTTAELQFRPVCADIPIIPDLEGVDTEPATDPISVLTSPGSGVPACGAPVEQLFELPVTPRGEIQRDQPIIAEQIDQDGNAIARYHLGPVPTRQVDGETVFLVGTAVDDAESLFTGTQYLVSLTMAEGDGGISLFNDLASSCFNVQPDCPTQRLAIVLDGNVESAAAAQAPAFDRDGIQLTGGFDQQRAEQVALVLRYGSLPVVLEQQQVRTVSASLGSDSLRAGIISGLIGLALVAVYMILYYRLLGVAALLSLAVSGAMLWVLISFFSETGFFFSGVTLTIAGVVGLIVSMGVSLDSNVVYFEHLKEDIINGRTLRSAVDRSFPVAFRTIFYADMAALIGAVILYTLTSSSVREFALMLGLASILDLVATYFFLRPLVRLLARSKRAIEKPSLLGLPSPRAVRSA